MEPGSVAAASAVIDTQTNTLAATVTVGNPSGVAVAPDGRRAYVPNWDSAHGRGVVSVVDTASSTVVETVAVSGRGGGRKGVAVTLDGRHVYVATDHELAEEPGSVSVIDTASNTVVTRIPVNPFPTGAAATPDGRFVYVLPPGHLARHWRRDRDRAGRPNGLRVRPELARGARHFSR
jgi:YVTN family beta-propeller protein